MKIKPSYDEKRQNLGKVLPLSTPFKMIIDSSEACNFRCSYCFRADPDRKKWGYAENVEVMKWEVFEKIVKQIKEFPEELKQISFSCHGEPLCNSKLSDMVKYLRENNIHSKISIHTNGALLNEHSIEEIAESGIDRIIVSVQGLSSEKYKEICGADIIFSEFYRNLEKLYKIKKGIEICIKIADEALETGEEENFYELFGKIADRVYIEKVVPIWKNINIKEKKNMSENKYGIRLEKQNCCPIIFHTLVVAPNGDVYPCTQLLENQVLGNVIHGSLYDFWNGDIRKHILESQLLMKKVTMCRDCNICQNSVFTPEDMIDKYSNEILMRLRNEQIY